MVTLTTEISSDQTAISGYRVVELSFDDVTPEFALKWARLEANSVEGNAFLSPHFAIPAVTHLESSYNQKPLILAVESGDGAELVALGLFEVARNSRLLPMTHLQSWRCEHTLFDGLLVDKQTAAAALDTLFDWLSRQGYRWQGIAFTDRSADGKLNDLLESAAGNSNATWFEDWSSEQ